jgi:hypothetical protein
LLLRMGMFLFGSLGRIRAGLIHFRLDRTRCSCIPYLAEECTRSGPATQALPTSDRLHFQVLAKTH